MLMVELLYQDLAVLDWIKSEWEYNLSSKDKIFSKFHSYLNNISEMRGKRVLPDEIKKTPKDIIIIKLVIKSVREYMIFFRRNKIINVPLQFVHIVPEGSNHEDSFFGGIVVERVVDDKIFAIKLFQKVFQKMSFSAVRAPRDRKLIFINTDNKFREAAASLVSRLFLKKVILNNDLFDNKDFLIEKDCFSIEAEKIFFEFLKNKWNYSNKKISEDKFFRNIVEMIINGGLFDEVKPEWF
jgi:hypothetical protein